MNVYEWRAEFFKRHGGYDSAIVECDSNANPTGFLLFPDGARCEASQEGGVEEPPADVTKRLKRVIRYREEMVRRAEETFVGLKHEIEGLHGEDGECNGPVPYNTPNGTIDLCDMDEALQVLDKAEDAVAKKRRELGKAREQLGRLTPVLKRREQREADVKIAQRHEWFRDQLKRRRI